MTRVNNPQDQLKKLPHQIKKPIQKRNHTNVKLAMKYSTVFENLLIIGRRTENNDSNVPIVVNAFQDIPI